MRTPLTLTFLTTLLLSLLLTLTTAAPTPGAAPDVPKGSTLNARSIPELLALKRANEKRGLPNVNGVVRG